jgi:chromosome segregation ATPase
VDAAHDTRRQLGQLMVDEGLLSAEELAHALQEQSETGKPLGETLVALGYASPGAVANALAEQHGGLLRTEFGVSTGLRTVPEDERPALHAAPPVAPVSVTSGSEQEHKHESGAPMGAGLRLARPNGEAAPVEAPAFTPAEPAPAPAAPEAAPAPVEEQAGELAKFASLHTDLDAARAELEQKSTHLIELTGRLDDTVSQLRASQAARDAFAAKAAELEARAEVVAEPDPAQAVRIQGLEQNVAELQAKLIEAAEAAAGAEPDPAEAARVLELEAQVEELTKVVEAGEARSQAETAHTQALEAQLTARVNELEAQLAAREVEPVAVEPDRTQVVRIQELEMQLRAATLERDGLVESLTELQTRLGDTAQSREAEVARANAVAAARVTAVESQLHAAATERDALSQSFEELQGMLSKTTAAHNASLDKLEEQLADREQRLAERADDRAEIDRAHRAALEQLERERDAAVRSFEELQGRIDETAAHEAERADDRAAIEREHRAALEQLERERDALARSFEELQGRMSETTAAHQASLADMEQQHGVALEHLERERNALAASFDELQGLTNTTTAAHETAVATLEEQLANRERLLSDRADEIEQLQRERDGLAQRSAELEERLADCERRLAENVDEMAGMNREHRAALDELEQERARAAEDAAAAVEPEESVHVLLIPAFTGYMLLERSGPAPHARAVVEIGPGSWGEGRFVVSRIGPSLLPDGPRRCAFLERA